MPTELFGSALGAGLAYIDEAQEISAEDRQALFNMPLYTQPQTWATSTDTSAGNLTVEHLRQAQQYGQTITVNSANWAGTYGSLVDEPEPEPRVVPITNFSEWMMQKYNKCS